MRLLAVITDRDLACRCLAEGRGPETTVDEIMSSDPSCCTPDAHVDEVERIMAERQVRRVPVVDPSGRCIGIIAQADLARAAGRRGVSEKDVARVVERVSQPTRSARRETGSGLRPQPL
jgi:signal-transduction protein with cAMP-binding, CBS, and nucleotidyltransferase domain